MKEDVTIKKRGRWRRVLRTLHRDIGFLCVGLCIIYTVSGVAVNHARDWDYNYSKVYEVHKIGGPAALLGAEAREGGAGDPVRLAHKHQAALVKQILAKLGRAEQPRKVFWRDPFRLSLHFDNKKHDIVDYMPAQGTATHRTRVKRFLLREFNFLHLNEPRGVWTLIADAYAVLLLFLALSGAIIVKGRRGLRGRGGVMLVIGLLIPLVALFFLQIR